jgi:hypothetical protein
VSQALGTGPNGGPIGFNSLGQLVERLPNQEYEVDEDGKPIEEMLPHYDMVLYRSAEESSEAYEEFRHKTWWTRHQNLLWHVKNGERINPEILKRAKAAAKEVEERYGRKELKKLLNDDFERGTIFGRMQALAWMSGMEWDESGDT